MPLTDVYIDGNTVRAFAPVSQFRGPYEFGGLLWIVAVQDLGVLPAAVNLRVYSSADNGLTWTERDAANRPVAVNTGGVVFDVAGGLLHIVYSDNVGLLLNYTTFNLAAATWGAIVGGGPAVALGSRSCWLGRSSGGQFEIMFAQTVGAFTRVSYVTYIGGVWGAPVQISGLGDDLPAENQSPQAFLVDSGDIVHCFWRSLGFAADTVWHRAIQAGVPGGAQQTYVQGTGATIHGLPGVPVEWNGQIVFPYAKFAGAARWPWVWYGNPSGVLLPVWTEEAVSAVQNTSYGAANQHFQALTARGADLYCWWATYNPGAGNMNSIYYAANSGGGWAADTFYFTDAPSNPFNDFFEQLSVVFLSTGAWGVYHDRISPADGQSSVAAYIVDQPAPPGTAAALQHAGFRRMVVLVPNSYDLALGQELALQRKLRPERQCFRPLLYHDIGWVRAPRNNVAFRKLGAVPTPLAAAGDVQVLSFRVPDGYDGVIAGLFHYYTGPGFQDGNGDIQWRLAINKVYAIHLGNVLVTLGSAQQAFPVDGGITVQSGNTIRYIVNVPNLSGGILPLATQIVCGLEGLFYARS